MSQEIIVSFERRLDENGNPYTIKISEEYVDAGTFTNNKTLEEQAQELIAQLQVILNQMNNG